MQLHWQPPGIVYDLSLLDKVTDSQGQTQKTYEPVVKSEMTDVSSHVWEDIHDGMRRVVQTHEQFNGLGVALSGKTGTAEIDYRAAKPWSFYRLCAF